MSRVSKAFSSKKTSVPPPTTVNHDGYPAYKRDNPRERYLQVLLTNTLSNTFYVDGETLLEESKSLHFKMVNEDPEYAAKAAIYARNHGYMRTQPVMALAFLSVYAPKEFAKAFDKIVLIPNDLLDFVAISMQVRAESAWQKIPKGKKISVGKRSVGGRAIRKVVNKWIVSKLTPFWAVKYGGEKSGNFSLRDVMRLYHPDFGGALSMVSFLMGRVPTKSEGEYPPVIKAFEDLKVATTDKEKIAAIKAGNLPHEVASTFAGKDPKVWTAIAESMPIFALLRNLATLERNGAINDTTMAKIKDTFTNPETVAKSKLFPFRFLQAFEKVNNDTIKDYLRDALDNSFINIPAFPGKTLVAVDLSGSMRPSYSGHNFGKGEGFTNLGLAASIFAMAIFKKSDAIISPFDTKTYPFSASRRDSLLTQATKLSMIGGGGTDTGASVRAAMDRHERYDNIIIITDEQQNTGSPFYREIVKYRNSINKNVKTFVIDVAPYNNRMVPEFDAAVWYMFGFSDRVLQFISHALNGFGSMVEHVENTKLDDLREVA